MRRRRKNGRRLVLAMLILLLAVCLGLLTIRFQRIFMEYAVNVCEDSAIKEINTLMEDEVFSHPDEFADLVVLERQPHHGLAYGYYRSRKGEGAYRQRSV